MQQASVIELPVSSTASGIPDPGSEVLDRWTLVDYLFPPELAPVWSGSVSGEPALVLAKAA